jgi:dienelactone hydrolase
MNAQGKDSKCIGLMAGVALAVASALVDMGLQFDPGGMIHWPGSEDLSFELMRLLGVAQEGGSTIAECLLAASRINAKDNDSWHREWRRMADVSSDRANAAFKHGNLPTAQSNWLRAISYYQASAFDLDPADKRRHAALRTMRACAHRYLEHLTPAGEVVEIPWLDGHALEGYFLPVPAVSGKTPVVVCMGEPGHRKEEHLCKSARYARDRGMSLLAVDLFGSGTGVQFEKIVGRPDLETAVGHVMDYLTTRDDIDERRIAIVGDGSGSSFVARGVALDRRFAAAVCDGGIWDLHERAFLMNRSASRNPDRAATGGCGRLAQDLACPVLITFGARGWLEAGRVAELFDRLRADDRDITLKIFQGSETAAAQAHADNPTLANEFIFDWLADRLGSISR